MHTGFASREWILGMLHDPQDSRYFGNTKIDDMKSMEKLGDEKLAAVTEFLYAEAQEPTDPPLSAALVKSGEQVFRDECMDCHIYKGEGADTFDGPDMTGYASRAWLQTQIAHPEKIYGDLNEMPAFADDLNAHDIDVAATSA